MTTPERSAIEQALAACVDPDLDCDYVSAGCVSGIDIDGGRVQVRLRTGYPLATVMEERARAVRESVEAVPGVEQAAVIIDWEIAAGEVQAGAERIDGVKNIIAVASGKGGVGKSTVAANLALALQAEGASVGVLDADIYGPSQPRMLGIEGRPSSADGKTLDPLEGHGLQVMSIGFLVDPENPMIWRGPMVTQALEKMLYNTRWRKLDYLVVDLPPGTGDIQLTLAQKVPLAGSIVVTTPQDIALIDARKGLKMFEKVAVPTLGLVENMSTHVCSQCGHVEPIFGTGGGETMAEDFGVRLLGQLPLTLAIREQSDGGLPTVVADPASEAAATFRQIARRATARLSGAGALPQGFPSVRIVDD
jgi:ATP-binding protein involved in chromosome partitioning